MSTFNEVLYFLALAMGILLLYKGSIPLFKVFFGSIPAPQGLREALAA